MLLPLLLVWWQCCCCRRRLQSRSWRRMSLPSARTRERVEERERRGNAAAGGGGYCAGAGARARPSVRRANSHPPQVPQHPHLQPPPPPHPPPPTPPTHPHPLKRSYFGGESTRSLPRAVTEGISGASATSFLLAITRDSGCRPDRYRSSEARRSTVRNGQISCNDPCALN